MQIYLDSELPQGSEVWKDFRKSKISATMATVIAETSPFQKPYKLWQELLGLIPPQAENFAMRRGKRLEAVARRRYEKLAGETFEPICVVNEQLLDGDGNPWVMASLDGSNVFLEKAIEIKCPGEMAHKGALQGIIPIYYQDQMLWQMLATENRIQAIDYFSFHPDFEPNDREACVPFSLKGNEARQSELLRMAEIFRDCVRNKVPPGGPEFERAAKLFVIANTEQKAAEKRLEEAKELLLKVSGGKPQSGCGVIISMTDRKGSLNTEKLHQSLIDEFKIPPERLNPEQILADVAKEFNVPDDRLTELKAKHTGLPKSVVSVKASNDAAKIYEAAIKEQQAALAEVDVILVSEDAEMDATSVAPTW